MLDEHSQVRSAAAKALAPMAKAGDLNVIKAFLRSSQNKLDVGDAKIISALISLLQDETGRAKVDAIEALSPAVMSFDSNVIESLIPLLRDYSESVRAAAIKALSPAVQAGNERVIKAFLQSLRTREALRSEVEVGNAVVIKALTISLRDKELEVRTGACQALGSSLKVGDANVVELLPLLQDNLPGVRAAAVQALTPEAMIGNTTVTDTLLPLLLDKYFHVRMAAAEALGFAVEAGNEDVIKAFLQSLQTRQVLHAKVKEGDAAVTKALMSLLNDRDLDVRTGVYQVLLQDAATDIRKSAMETLTSLVQCEVKRGRSAVNVDDTDVLAALENLSPDTKARNVTVTDALLPLLKDKASQVRSAAAEALTPAVREGNEKVVRKFLQSLKTRETLRSEVKVANTKLVDTLGSMMQDDELEVRTYACQVLGRSTR